MKTPKINASYSAMGFYTCIDENTYDGAPDSGSFARMIGTGRSLEAAIADYYQQLTEYYEENGDENFIYSEFCEAEKLADRIDLAKDTERENG